MRPKNTDMPASTLSIYLLTLLRQQGGVVPAVIDRMGADRDKLRAGVEQLLAAKSRVSGGAVELRLGRELAQLLEEAETIAANMKDEYTSTEHLLMAMASARNGNCPSTAGAARHRL